MSKGAPFSKDMPLRKLVLSESVLETIGNHIFSLNLMT